MGDQLPPHKYMKNIFACGTVLTENLNPGRRPQTSKKARQSPQNKVGQRQRLKKKKKKDKGFWDGDLHPGEGAVREEKYLHTQKPLHGRGQRGASEPQTRLQQQVFRRQNRGKSPEIAANQHFPA